jgi:monofunctional glycosyltransferase
MVRGTRPHSRSFPHAVERLTRMTPTSDRPRIRLRNLAWIFLLPALVWLVHPWPLPLRWKNPGTTAFMEARLQQARSTGDSLVLVQEWVPLTELPTVLVRAVLVAEDDRFREHAGVDWVGLAEEVRYRGPIPPDLRNPEHRAALAAAWNYVRENRDQVRGRSTLTQQLARNLYLSEDRSFVRKGQEFLLARRLEFFLDKDRILELYLNVAEFGPGIFGVEAAARTYFQRSARDLTLYQAASLAGTLPHPLTSNPAHRPSRMAWRRDRILQRLGGGPPVPILPPEPVPILLPPAADTSPPDIPPPPDVPPPPDDPPPPDSTVPGGPH